MDTKTTPFALVREGSVEEHTLREIGWTTEEEESGWLTFAPPPAGRLTFEAVSKAAADCRGFTGGYAGQYLAAYRNGIEATIRNLNQLRHHTVGGWIKAEPDTVPAGEVIVLTVNRHGVQDAEGPETYDEHEWRDSVTQERWPVVGWMPAPDAPQ